MPFVFASYLQRLVNSSTQIERSDPNHDISLCRNDQLFAKLHDPRPSEQKAYERRLVSHINQMGFLERDPASALKLRTLAKGAFYARWTSVGRTVKQSAWTEGNSSIDSNEEVTGITWVGHRVYDKNATRPDLILEGNAIAFASWFTNNFGHVVHDNLPALSWVKEQVDDLTTFILPDTLAYRGLLNIIDPDFLKNRVLFTKDGDILQVKGSLSVIVPDKDVIGMGNVLFDFFR